MNSSKADKELPSSAQQFNERGLTYLIEGSLQKALIDFSSAISLKSDYFEAIKNKGIVNERLEKWDEGYACFSTAIKLNSADADLFAHRGFICFQLGKIIEGARDFVKAIQNDFDYLYFNSTMYHDHDLTIEELKRLDLFLGHSGDIFVTTFEKACDIEPKNVHFKICLSILLIRYQRYEDAIRVLNQAIESTPESEKQIRSTLHCFRSSSLHRMNQPAKATIDADLSIQLDSQNPLAHCMKGVLVLKNEESEKALKHFSQAKRLKGDFCLALVGSALCHSEFPVNYELAMNEFNAAAKICPRFALIYSARANAKYEEFENESEKEEDVIKDYEIALRLNPKDAKTYYTLASVIVEYEDYDKQKALNNFTHAIELLKNEKKENESSLLWKSYRGRGMVYSQIEKIQESKDDFEMAIKHSKESDPEPSEKRELYNDLGDVFLQLLLTEIEQQMHQKEEDANRIKELFLGSICNFCMVLKLKKEDEETPYDVAEELEDVCGFLEGQPNLTFDVKIYCINEGLKILDYTGWKTGENVLSKLWTQKQKNFRKSSESWREKKKYFEAAVDKLKELYCYYSPPAKKDRNSHGWMRRMAIAGNRRKNVAIGYSNRLQVLYWNVVRRREVGELMNPNFLSKEIDLLCWEAFQGWKKGETLPSLRIIPGCYIPRWVKTWKQAVGMLIREFEHAKKLALEGKLINPIRREYLFPLEVENMKKDENERIRFVVDRLMMMKKDSKRIVKLKKTGMRLWYSHILG